MPFLFATNGRPFLCQIAEKSGIWFLDARHDINHPRALEAWHSPEGLSQPLQQDIATADARLAAEPTDYLPLRDHQAQAVRTIEHHIAAGQRELLVAMATGSGKKITCVNHLHADLLVHLLKQAFDDRYGPAPDDTVKKITRAVDQPSQIIRRVRSRILLEQMLGRATRLCPDLYGHGLDKERFYIFDAVNIYDDLEDVSDMHPAPTRPYMTFWPKPSAVSWWPRTPAMNRQQCYGNASALSGNNRQGLQSKRQRQDRDAR